MDKQQLIEWHELTKEIFQSAKRLFLLFCETADMDEIEETKVIMNINTVLKRLEKIDTENVLFVHTLEPFIFGAIMQVNQYNCIETMRKTDNNKKEEQ